MIKKEGFTFVELLVVIFIILVLSIIAFTAIGSYQKNNQKKICETNIQQILTGIERYKRVNGSYPADQAGFETVLKNTTYFETIPLNPYWNDNDNTPEKGWIWEPNTLSVIPKKP